MPFALSMHAQAASESPQSSLCAAAHAALDESTRDEAGAPPAAGFELVSTDAGAPLAFDWFAHVATPWARRTPGSCAL